MDYSHFKALQALLFFGAAFGVGFWQLYALRRDSQAGDDEEDAKRSR